MPKHPPKVSVIIPAYNREPYIRQAIDSVLNQTFENIELIIVDDGSIDGTMGVLESYGNRIYILEHPGRINKGQSAAINLGLRHATGNYIAILDSDDYWELNKIELQVNYLNKRQELGLVYGNGIAVDEHGNYLYDIYSTGHKENNKPENIFLDCYFLVPNNSLIRSGVFKITGGFDENLRSAQDHDMAIRIAEVTKLGYLDRPVFCYRRHSQSISQKNARMRWQNGFIIINKARQRYPYSMGVIYRRKAVLHYRLYQCLTENSEYLKAIYHLLLSGIYDPRRALNVLSGKEKVTGPH